MTDKVLVQDKKIVSLDEAREELVNKPRSMGSLNDFATRKEVLTIAEKLITAAGTAAGLAATKIGEEMYEQMTHETITNLELMERVIMDNVLLEIERRSLRGRIRRRRRAFMARVRDYAIEIGWVSPIEEKTPKPDLQISPNEILDEPETETGDERE